MTLNQEAGTTMPQPARAEFFSPRREPWVTDQEDYEPLQGRQNNYVFRPLSGLGFDFIATHGSRRGLHTFYRRSAAD